jgi:crotonobetaine/carnitine-CoA ligase
MMEGRSQKMVLGQLVEQQALARPDDVFLDFRGEFTVTYGQLHELSSRFANGFLANGIRKGAKVAVMMANCPEYLYCWFGLAKIGAVMVPVNTAHKGDLLQYIIDSSDAEAIVVDSSLLGRVQEISGIGKVGKVFINGTLSSQSATARPDVLLDNVAAYGLTLLAALAEESADTPAADIKHSDPMTILFTSGTTGPSKGVVMSHNYYLCAARTIGGGMGVNPADVLYTCLPLFHVNAQVCTVLSALLFSARVAMYERFSAGSFWDEIRDSRATVFLALGAMGNILFKADPRPEDSDNNIRLAMVVPPPDDLEAFETRFGLKVVYETFGLTEGIVAPPRITEPRRPGCCGRPEQDTEVRIVDDFDRQLPPRQVGEIIMRTREPYSMMSGYYKMPEATLDAFRNLWFHTGDLGYMDEDGYLYFAGRKKEAIRRRGENISAYEVERIVNQHPAVLESAAVPVPSELSEDDVKIVVVLKEGQKLTPEAVIEFCEQRMAYFMVPRFVEFRNELPKTPTQRVEKYKLAWAEAGTATWDREKAGYELKR